MITQETSSGNSKKMTLTTKRLTKAEAAAVVSRLKSKSTREWLLVSDMKVDPRAQRTLRESWCKKRVDGFDPDHLGTICVSRRSDGSVWVMDGQHRVELVRMVGWGDQLMDSEVFENLTIVEEAALFLHRNDKVAQRTIDKFQIGVTAQEETPVAIQKIVHSLGLKIADRTEDGSVTAVTAMRWVYEGAHIGSTKDGAIALKATLNTLLNAWGTASANFQGDVISGLGLIYLRYGKKVDSDHLVATLIKLSGGAVGLINAGKLIREGVGGRLAKCVAAAAIHRYNRSRRGAKKLEGWES